MDWYSNKMNYNNYGLILLYFIYTMKNVKIEPLPQK